MKEIRVSLLIKVAIAIVASVLFSQFLPGGIARIFVAFNSLFGNFLLFSISLIILGLMAPAIGDLSKRAGKLLLITALIVYGSTVFSGFFTFLDGSAVFSHILPTNTELTAMGSLEGFILTPYLVVNMPSLIDVVTALLLSPTIGLGFSNVTGTTLRDSFAGFKEVIIKLTEVVIILLLPLHIFGIFLNMTVSGRVMSTITMFLKVIIVIFALRVLLLLVQSTITGAIAGKNPLRFLENILSVCTIALGTQSFATTIPMTLAQAVKNGVRENIAVFIVPLYATIHLAGSTMKIVVCAMATMIMAGEPVIFSNSNGSIVMLGITMIVAPGVPGGVIMATLGTLQSMLGLNEMLQALMIALYIAMDSLGTAYNVTGDGVITVMVGKITGGNTP